MSGATSPREPGSPRPPGPQLAGGAGALRRAPLASGLLVAGAGAPLGIERAEGYAFFQAPIWLNATAVAAVVLLGLGGLTLVRRPRLGSFAASLGVLATFAIGLPHLRSSPAVTLLSLLACSSGLLLLWPFGSPSFESEPPSPRALAERARGASLSAGALWLLWTFTKPRQGPLDAVVVGWAMALACSLACAWALRNRRAHRLPSLTILGSFGFSCGLFVLLWGDAWWMVSGFLGPALLALALTRNPPRLEADGSSWQDFLLGHAERLFVGTFAGLCLGGALLLAHPKSAASGEGIGFADALFTSASAVCVTGLVVVDTASAFSGFGQLMILFLIQIGGLGIMTFSTAVLWALGRRISLRHEGAVARLISTQDHSQLYATAKHILQLTAAVEATGAALLSLAFLSEGDPPTTAVWRGTFTSISAFCNAGFALQSDSLVPYQHSPLVLHTVAALIIVGGLSPLVVFSVPKMIKPGSSPASAQARLALAAAAALLVGGFAFTLALEYEDSLAGLSLVDKLHNAWLQSATLRTAGFNSVDLRHTRAATLPLMIAWMFIGGSPGGTAGGVKTTTVAVLVLSVFHAIRGKWVLEAFGKRIPERARAKALVVVTIATMAGLSALVALLLTQDMSPRLAAFEVASALGTVGLTLGGTAQLDGVGRGIVIACMFVGRVGGLTLLMFLSSSLPQPAIRRPEEEIDVG